MNLEEYNYKAIERGKKENIIMGYLIFFGIIAVVCFISKASTNAKFNNYDMDKVSIGKMSMDAGKSKSEIRRNLVNGKYDKDDKWKV